MLVAAKVDAENPHRAAKIINSHPGVSHNYLRTHEFNLWFTIATPPDSELGLAGHARGPAAADRRRVDPPAADPDAVQDQHEPRDGEGHRRARRRRRGGRRRASSSAQPYDDTDIAVIRALQGPMAVDRAPLRRRRRRGRDDHRGAARPPARGWSSARSCAGSRRSSIHRRAGFSANGMGVWRVPDERDPRDRHADGRGPRDLALLPAPHLRRLALLGLHDGPRPLEGGVRRDPRSRSPTSTTSTATTAPSSTPRPSSRRSGCTTSPPSTRSGSGEHAAASRSRSPLERQPSDERRVDGHPHLRSPLRPRRRAAARRGQLARCGRCGRSAATPDLRRARRGLRADRRRRQPLRRLGLLLGAR